MNVRSLWRELPPAHRRWIVLNALIVTAVVNLVINAGLAWGSSAGEHRVPLWSVPLVEKPSTVVDTVGTFFLLPLITCLLITTVARHDVAAGWRVDRLAVERDGKAAVGWRDASLLVEPLALGHARGASHRFLRIERRMSGDFIE